MWVAANTPKCTSHRNAFSLLAWDVPDFLSAWDQLTHSVAQRSELRPTHLNLPAVATMHVRRAHSLTGSFYFLLPLFLLSVKTFRSVSASFTWVSYLCTVVMEDDHEVHTSLLPPVIFIVSNFMYNSEHIRLTPYISFFSIWSCKAFLFIPLSSLCVTFAPFFLKCHTTRPVQS